MVSIFFLLFFIGLPLVSVLIFAAFRKFRPRDDASIRLWLASVTPALFVLVLVAIDILSTPDDQLNGPGVQGIAIIAIVSLVASVVSVVLGYLAITRIVLRQNS